MRSSPTRATRHTSWAWATWSKLDKDVPFVGRGALRREQAAGGPPRRLVGLDLDWADLERLYGKHGLAPALSAEAWRERDPHL